MGSSWIIFLPRTEKLIKYHHDQNHSTEWVNGTDDENKGSEKCPYSRLDELHWSHHLLEAFEGITLPQDLSKPDGRSSCEGDNSSRDRHKVSPR